MKLLLFAGFLGSGKTTVILTLAPRWCLARPRRPGYDLPAATIDLLMGDVLASLLGPAGVDWGKRAESRGHQEPC